MLAFPRTAWLGIRSWNLAATGLKLAAGAVLLLASSERPAQASCGDYVLVGGHATTADHGGRSQPDTPICHGPNCQRQLPLPIGPEKGAQGGGAPQWACWFNPVSAERVEPAESFGHESVALADGHTLAPWRPPSL